MKIGVITYHKELSQGATFQAYATYRALRELGCEVVVIDLAHNPKSPRPKWQTTLISLYMSLSNKRQEAFRKKYYPPFSQHYLNWIELKNNPPQVDAICVGSDQTWNKRIATSEDFMAYFLDFGRKEMPRFSYASSFGFSDWMFADGEETERIGRMLRSYIGLSVRESTAKRLIYEKFGLTPVLVCDPTLLHRNYDEFTQGVKQRDEVLCYSLNPSSDHKLQAIKDISNFKNLPIRWVGKPFWVKGVKNTYFPDVYRWFRYIAGSQYILTDSFHGTVASILCHKPFFVLYKNDGLSSRILDLLTRLGLEDRICFSYEEFCKNNSWKNPINYEEVDKKLAAYREESWFFLREVVDKIRRTF